MRKMFILAAFAGLFMTSCKKSDSNSNAKVSDTIQSKWNVTQNGASPINSIEFLYGNTYIIQDIGGEFHKSSYNIQADNKTVILTDYGSLEVTSLSSSSMQFKLKPTGYPAELALSATAAAKIGSGSNTSILCGKSWTSYKDVQSSFGSAYDTTYYPDVQGSGIVKREIIFSINKTYFVTTVMTDYNGGYTTTYYNNNWDWANSGQTRISYGVAPVGYVVIDVLGSNELDMHEEDQTYVSMFYFLH